MFIDANLIFGGLFMLQNGLLQQYLTGETTSIVDAKRLQARSPIRFILLVCLDCRSSAQFGRSEITHGLVPRSV
jgi:hypothetical protein